MEEKRIGINGFGRIGRAIFRIMNSGIEQILINDINPDNKNIAYQLKYDSLYGVLDKDIKADDKGIYIDGKKIFVYHKKNIDDVPWEKHGITRIIDSSGVYENVIRARNLCNRNIRQVIITHSPNEKVLDRSVIMGVNEDEIDTKKDFIISSSICDAIAFAPIAKLLDKEYGIDNGFLTTLHPWLQYQNLLDGPSPSWSIPGNIDSHYILGRASTFSLMPKPTTTIDATCKVLRLLKDKFDSFSFRVPTAIVSCSDISIKLKKKAKSQDIINLFIESEKKQDLKIFHNNFEPLVSIDFKGTPYSTTIDHRWTVVNKNNYLKLISWYDNEWGYSSRVVDLVDYLFSKKDN